MPPWAKVAIDTWAAAAGTAHELSTPLATMTRRRPNRSAAAPINGAAIMPATAPAMTLVANSSTPAPNSANRRANSGRIMTNPVNWSAMHADRMKIRLRPLSFVCEVPSGAVVSA